MRKTLLYSGTGRERERGADRGGDTMRAFHAYIIPLSHYPNAHKFQKLREGAERVKSSTHSKIIPNHAADCIERDLVNAISNLMFGKGRPKTLARREAVSVRF